MAVIRNLVVKIAADISSLSAGLQKAEKKLKGVSNSFGKIGNKLTANITAPLMAITGLAVKVSAEFEQSMANAASVSGATGEELERMKEIAREMGAKTVFSASQAADAMYYMASAGYKVEQMGNAIQPILDLAAATQSDLAFTTDTVVASLNQFQLDSSEAERVTNVFAAAIGASQATLDKLGNSMHYVGPVANGLGWSIEETAGALSVLYNAGFDGSMAGTSLRQSLTALMNPSAQAKKIFDELGISLEDLNPTTNSMADIVNRLKNAGISTAQAMEVFGARAGPGMMALIAQGGDAIADMTTKITDTQSASVMAEKQLDTLQGRAKILKSQVEELALQIGDMLIPALSKLVGKYISPLAERLGKLNAATKETVAKTAMFAASIGPLCLVISKVVGVVATLAKIIPKLTAGISPASSAFLLLAVIIGKMIIEDEEFRNGILKLLKALSSLATNAVKPLYEILKSVVSVLGRVVNAIKPVITWTVKAVTAVIEWLDKSELLEFALWSFIAVLGILTITHIPAFIASLWQGIIAVGQFIIAVGTTAIQAIGKFVVTLLMNACFALGSFKLALASVSIGLAAMAVGIGLAFAVFKNWDIMNGVQRVIAVIGTLTAIVLGAALAFGLFHSAWSLGLAVAGIVAGIVAVTAAIITAQKNIPKGGQVDVNAMSNDMISGIKGYATGGIPDRSTLFYANEFGNPELVANFGGGTAVANNEMIVSAIESAAYKGMQKALLEQSGSEQTVTLEINGREFARATFDDLRVESKRRGGW